MLTHTSICIVPERVGGWVGVFPAWFRGLRWLYMHFISLFSEPVGKIEMSPGAAEESGCVALKQTRIAVRVSHG